MKFLAVIGLVIGVILVAGLSPVAAVPVARITTGQYQNDFPSIAIAPNGDEWGAWTGYKAGSDDVLVRGTHDGKLREPTRITERPGDYFGTAMAFDGKGRLWVVWSERQGTDWNLVSRTFDGKSWNKPRKITQGRGSNLFHRLAADPKGNLYLVWQGFRGSRSDIYLKSLSGGKVIDLSDPRKGKRVNDWMPAITVETSGKVWVAWDSYDTGSYNIRLRAIENGKPRPIMKVTDSPRCHANASIAVDGKNRVWVAYEEAAENWGKQQGLLFHGGSELYGSRKIRIAVLDNGKWLEPKDDLNKRVPPDAQRYVESPRVIADASGNIWAIFHPMTFSKINPSPFKFFAKWELMASCYSGDKWSEPITLPESAGRCGSPFDAAVDAKGQLVLAWVTDQRRWEDPYQTIRNSEIMTASIPGSAASAVTLFARTAEPPTAAPAQPNEQQMGKVRDYAIKSGGKTYRIYRGDLHRHSEFSGDGIYEGTIWGVYRYMLDAGALDFGANADHNGSSATWGQYPWWRSCQAADIFNAPGNFTTFFAYERSMIYPGGHWNVVLGERAPSLDLSPEEASKGTGTAKTLFPYLRTYHGIAIQHTSATAAHGCAWLDYGGEVEPLCEIFQGLRVSSEHEGAPLAPPEGSPDSQVPGKPPYRSDGWLWNGWAKGYKLGVIASSDHSSAGCSYACVLAENNSREAIMDAMRKRHTYGATSNIIMDFRTRDSTGEHIMGDITNSKTIPELSLKVICTAPIKEVVIIRDNKYVDRRPGTGEEMSFAFKEPSLEPGEHYYYARVEQTDKHVVWSSPIWVTYQP